MCDITFCKALSVGRSSMAAWTLKLSFGSGYWKVFALGLCLITLSLIALFAGPKNLSSVHENKPGACHHPLRSLFLTRSNTTLHHHGSPLLVQVAGYSGKTWNSAGVSSDRSSVHSVCERPGRTEASSPCPSSTSGVSNQVDLIRRFCKYRTYF